MKEYTETIKFDKGLRPYDDLPKNDSYLTECYNMVPGRGSLKAFEPITNPIVGMPAIEWPYTQMFCLGKFNLLCTRNTIYKLDSSFIPTVAVNVVAGVSPWQVADFIDYAVLTNGSVVLEIDPTTEAISQYLGGVDLPVMGTICNFKGQLIAGNVAGYASNAVVWGRIGSASLAQDADGITGYRLMPWQGAVKQVMRLGDYLMAYSAGGVAVLAPASDPMPTFRFNEAYEFGVAAVGGGIGEHLIVDEGGKLWRVSRELKFEELGFEEFIAPMLGPDLLVSFNANTGDYYLSDGTLGYMLSRYGLCEIHQLVASAQFYSGGLIGVFDDNGDETVLVQTEDFDFNLSGRNTIEVVELVGNVSGTSVYLNDGVKSTASVLTNPQGAARIKMAGDKLRVGVTAPSYTGLAFNRMNIRWKMEDKRFVRSTHANQVVARADR